MCLLFQRKFARSLKNFLFELTGFIKADLNEWNGKMNGDGTVSNQNESVHDAELNTIRDALRGLRFGSVNIIVQDGVIVQIDRTDKKRLRQNSKLSEGNSR